MKPLRIVPSILVLILALAPGQAAYCGEADIVAAEIRKNADGTFSVSATVRHDDEGWEHYADRFDVVTPDGTVIGERVLAHPHVDEQPFTRSLDGIAVPDGVTQLRVRAHDKVHGLGGKEAMIASPQ